MFSKQLLLFSSGICPEPGGVPFSSRLSTVDFERVFWRGFYHYNDQVTKAHLTGPYYPGSLVAYECFTGELSTITCTTSGNWTQKPPTCRGQACFVNLCWFCWQWCVVSACANTNALCVFRRLSNTTKKYFFLRHLSLSWRTIPRFSSDLQLHWWKKCDHHL